MREVLARLTTETEETVGEQSDCSSLAEDMTEGSVDLGLLTVQLAGRHHLGPQIFPVKYFSGLKYSHLPRIWRWSVRTGDRQQA